MFEYAVYAMDYEDAMTHLSFLKSLPKKNLRIFAHLHGMSHRTVRIQIDSMLKETSSSFAERRFSLCETDVNPHIPKPVEAALYLYTSVHKRENIGFDDDRIFTFDFDRAEFS